MFKSHRLYKIIFRQAVHTFTDSILPGRTRPGKTPAHPEISETDLKRDAADENDVGIFCELSGSDKTGDRRAV